MSKTIILFLMVFPLASINCYLFRTQNNFQKDKNKIEWCSEYKLIWEDFKGLRNDSINQFIIARTSGEIKAENGRTINGVPKFDIKCYFIKNKSWTVVNDKETLAHEQLHFDIFEIYARKIRKAYDSLSNKNVKEIEVYQKKYNTFIEECNKYNDIYDNQVYFNEEKQKEWSLKIAKELEELKAYEMECPDSADISRQR